MTTFALIIGALMLLLNILDVHSTYLFQSVGVREANPIFGPNFEKHPLWKAAAAKIVLSLVLIGCMYGLRDNPTYLALLTAISTLVCVYYIYIVSGNYRIYRSKKNG